MAKEALKEGNAVEIVESTAAESIAGKVTVTAGGRKETAKAQIPGKEQKVEQESVYPMEELAANAGRVFGTRQECVMVALRAAGTTEYTVSKAKEIVGSFLKKEVK